MGRELFRIVRNATSTLDDFRSARNLGKPLISTKYQREWAEGISTYDDLTYAIERARINRGLLGAYVVRMVLPDDDSIEVAQTTRDRHHYSLYAPAERLMELVVLPTIRVIGE